MADPLSQILAGARSRWMIGGELAVADHPLIAGQSASEAGLRLLAVAGQFQRLQQRPVPPALNVKPDLPTLALPHVPDALRPLARRVLADKADRGPLWLALFAAKRGFVLHPADWMPPPSGEVPEAYRPLQLWQADKSSPTDTLTAETWLDHEKAERLDQIRRLRASDPARARDVLAECLTSCPAEERLSLVEALATGLCDEDAAFLESLSADRSEKLRKAAVNLLARLGRAEADPVAAEAAEMFEAVTEGILRRRKVVRLNPKAKEGQLRTLVQSLQALTLPGLASALGLTGAEFAERWQPEKVSPNVQAALSEMIARSATDAEVTLYWQQLRAQPEFARNGLSVLFPRLGVADQQAAALWLIEHSGLAACPEVLSLIGVALPPPVSAALTARRKDLADLVRQIQAPPPEKAAAARNDALRLSNALSLLGLMVTADDAALIARTVTDAGLHPADPMLDRLNFNAALKGS